MEMPKDIIGKKRKNIYSNILQIKEANDAQSLKISGTCQKREENM